MNTIDIFNHLFYYLLLYTPLVFWVAYKFGLKSKVDILEKWFLNKIEQNSNIFSIKRLFYLWLFGNLVFYMVVGAIAALFEIFIGFAPAYDIKSSYFIFDILKDGFKISLIVLIYTFARISFKKAG